MDSRRVDQAFDAARGIQPLAPGDQSNTRAHGGLGLGLATVQRLVWAMGGLIDVDSRLGVGTTFRVRLPVG